MTNKSKALTLTMAPQSAAADKAALPRVYGAGEHGRAHPLAKATRRRREQAMELAETVRGLLGALDHSTLNSVVAAGMVGKHEHAGNASRAQDYLDEAYGHTIEAATTCRTLRTEVCALSDAIDRMAEVQEDAGALLAPDHPED